MGMAMIFPDSFCLNQQLCFYNTSNNRDRFNIICNRLSEFPQPLFQGLALFLDITRNMLKIKILILSIDKKKQIKTIKKL